MHAREGFDCGKSSLNDFLRALVTQYEKRNLGRTYVATEGDNRRVVGYYTLSSGSIHVDSLPAEEGKKLQVRGYIGFFFRTQTWLRVQ